MKASRKHYVRIARILNAAHALAERGYDGKAIVQVIANDLADVLKEANGTFQRDTFLFAAGVEDISK